MPALDVKNPGVSVVADMKSVLSSLLEEALAVKKTSAVEPALNKSDLADLCSRVLNALGPVDAPTTENGTAQTDTTKSWRYIVIETAVRDIFGKLIVSSPIPGSHVLATDS